MSYKELKVIHSKTLPEVLVFEPSVFWDLRGNIYTSFNSDSYKPYIGDLEFKHDKFALNKQNVLRGLHGDYKTWKLVSCVWGELFEVVVDMRPESPTYKKWDSFILSSEKYMQVLIPPGFVNGYFVKSENAVFHYKLAYSGDYLDADRQMTFLWNDSEIGIDWPCKTPILQDRDK